MNLISYHSEGSALRVVWNPWYFPLINIKNIIIHREQEKGGCETQEGYKTLTHVEYEGAQPSVSFDPGIIHSGCVLNPSFYYRDKLPIQD